jgi:hypothetical protein
MTPTKKTGIVVAIGAVACAGTYFVSRGHKPPMSAAGGGTTVTVENRTGSDTTVYFAFGADSVVKAADWASFCTGSGLVCNAPLKAHASMDLPTGGHYLNVTFAFGSAVGCHVTKAELNVNNHKWYDVLDVSLVDGYSNDILIEADSTKIGPPQGATGNEKVFGLYPVGCDICVAREHPPCGMTPGKDGCKSGGQYNPDVPCQYQGSVMGGGEKVKVALIEPPTKF